MSRPAGGEIRDQSVSVTHIGALLLVLALFYLHTLVLFDIAGLLVQSKGRLVDALGPHRMGKVLILGCFLVLFVTHLAEAALWALFLRWRRIFPQLSDGLYFAAVTITTLGYGDVILPMPFRHIAPLIAVSGVLMFGCSTAFIFVLMQQIWALNL